MDVFNSGRLTNKIVMSLYYPGGYVGVGLFFMITGYFGIYKTATKARLKNLCVEILHYALLSAAVTMIWSTRTSKLRTIAWNPMIPGKIIG